MPVFITTPIFYASGSPHLGHVYSGFVADTIKRYVTLKGPQAFLITGTDENGQKIERKAGYNGIDTCQFVNHKSSLFKSLWQNLGIQPDCFIRTTCKSHHILVAEIWKKLCLNDYIYLGSYEGLYCVECEQYYSEWQLINDCCPVHKRPVDAVSEPSYLFRLDKVRLRLLDFFISHPNFIQPDYLQKALIEQLRATTLGELSISRTLVKWGVPVPGHEEHIVYVWLDALFSYISALRDLNQPNTAIEDTVHVIGKDILQFHGIYWLAFLLAVDLPPPKNIIVHGWWTIAGEKIAKSNPGNSIPPAELVKTTTIDGLRYGLLRQKPLDRDGDLSIHELVKVINSDLANNLGNLVKRFVTLVNKYFNGYIQWDKSLQLDDVSNKLLDATNTAVTNCDQAYIQYNFQLVCTILNDIVGKTNAYFHNREPWKANKGIGLDNVSETLLVVNAVLSVAYKLYSPVIPELAQKIQYQLRQENHSLTWPIECSLLDVNVRQADIIFGKIQHNAI